MAELVALIALQGARSVGNDLGSYKAHLDVLRCLFSCKCYPYDRLCFAKSLNLYYADRRLKLGLYVLLCAI